MQALAQQAAEVGDNMTEATKGGGGRLLPEGYAFARLVSYVELGSQPQEYGGKAKEPALEFRLGFALWGQGYQNEDGTPYVMYTFDTSMSRNEKAGAFLLFKALNWKGTATHFAQLLGESYLLKIITHKPADAAKKPSSRIDLKGFLPPLDPVTRNPYPIPAARDEDLELFLWNLPTKEGWDALYQEGQFDDGGTKNKTQSKLVSALDFAGSALEALLLTSGSTIPAKLAPKAAPATPATPAAALPSTPAVPTVPVSQPVQPAAVVASVPPPVAALPVVPECGLPAVPTVGTTTSPSEPVAAVVAPVAPVVPAFAVLPSMPVLPAVPA
jgi:hypothetical protein